jgi:hypothetical protein
VVIRRRKSQKERQHNDQNKKDKGTNNHLQNITQKTKDRATHPTTNNGVNSGDRRAASVTNPEINHE